MNSTNESNADTVCEYYWHRRRAILSCECICLVLSVLLVVVGAAAADWNESCRDTYEQVGSSNSEVRTRNCTEQLGTCSNPERPCLCQDLVASYSTPYCAEQEIPASWGIAVFGLGFMMLFALCCCGGIFSFVLFAVDSNEWNKNNRQQHQQAAAPAYPATPPPEVELSFYPSNPDNVPPVASMPVVTPVPTSETSDKIPIAYAKPLNGN